MSITSPHLVRFNERIRLAGKLIDEEALVALLEECERANAGHAITFFEITTAAAFLAFARTPADIVLLETGLGGRFDATNVIAAPAVTAITPVSLDHQHFLGDTVAAIAGREGRHPEAGRAGRARRRSSAEGSRRARSARHRDRRAALPPWPWNGMSSRPRVGPALSRPTLAALDLPPPGLLGAHQYDNAGTALACLDCAEGFALAPAALARGMTEVEWPARLQPLTRGALARLLPAGWELWLDGGHNAGRRRGARRTSPRRGATVRSNSSSACSTRMTRAASCGRWRPMSRGLGGVAIPGEANALSVTEAVAAARDVGIAAAPRASIAEAIDAATRRRPRDVS